MPKHAREEDVKDGFGFFDALIVSHHFLTRMTLREAQYANPGVTLIKTTLGCRHS